VKRRLRAVTGALAVMLALTGCVGPARTTSVYVGKAVRTAQDSLSQLQTALLSVQTSLRGRLMQPYLETVLSNSEDAFSSIQATFTSIQPPNSVEADQARDSLEGLLSEGADGITQLRILARRRDTGRLAAEADKLVATADGLDSFAQKYGG
jgi:hypothetical protein